MSKLVNVLNKALSTSSEEEAIACLRMARKTKELIPVLQATTTAANTYKGYSAQAWHTVAAGWKHKYDSEIGARGKESDYNFLYEYYFKQYYCELENSKALKKQITSLKQKANTQTIIYTAVLIVLNVIYLLLLAFL